VKKEKNIFEAEKQKLETRKLSQVVKGTASEGTEKSGKKD